MKKDVEKAIRDLEILQRLYNSYFQGGEKQPPREQRRQLDALIAKIKMQIATASNASDKFIANSTIARYQSMVFRWEKTLKGIEDGTIARPSKRD